MTSKGNSTQTVYEALKAAGCYMSNHYSDLYVENTDIARKIVISTFEIRPDSFFKCGQTGKQMMELAFAYDPFWEDKGEAKF